MRVEIQSRRGNIVVGTLGIIYIISAVILLVIHASQTAGAASLTDRAIQVLLVAVIAVSVWFITIAARGLGMPLRRGVRTDRAGAAARP